DLFFQKTLIDGAKCGLRRIAETTCDTDSAVAVGAPLIIGGRLYNCAVMMSHGRVDGIVVKTFIPTYNEYYEKRWFSSAAELKISSVGSDELGLDGEYDIPVGGNLIFNYSGVKVGVEICEDLWAPLPPSTLLTLAGAEVILNLSASNETIMKRKYRTELVSQQSARSICAYAYASAGMTESTTDLIFSGHSLICENGGVLCQNDSLIDGGYSLKHDVDLGRIRADRAENKTFGDSAALYLDGKEFVEVKKNLNLESDGGLYEIKKLPFVPSAKKDRIERCMDIFRMQVAGLKKRASKIGGKMVLGVSGGLDSTLALLVCAETARQLGRDPSDVVAITLPCFGTTKRTHSNAWELMQTLGVHAMEIDIKEACTLHCRDIGHPTDQFDVTYENIQARERTQVLMDYACKLGGFVVGTGDLSELALGWCTYNADHMSMYGVNCGVPKTLVRWMISALIDYNVFPESTRVLEDIIDTPISPELLPPDADGNIQQETEEIIGPYALHDFFLYYLLRFGFSPSKIFFLAEKAFREDFDSETILKWLEVFYKRFFTQQFKRSCLPDGVKIGSVCLSPRGDWRMPSDASYKIWIDEIEKLK
ncbi:MAG: NAD(+) synthase, partial [Clostridiaceae bacterium]|nr:NAD(+) synthase [Clostridiaceae bacterium]MDY5888972.1 NAD(+) synthase [Oscillospiraceae bacterium]